MRWFEIRRQLFDVLDGLPGDAPAVVKAIALAFPILDATFALRHRVPERIGLVRRYLLEGLCRLGPMTAAQFDELLGLGPDLISQALTEMTGTIPGLSRLGDSFSASAEACKLLDDAQFTRFVSHRHRFLVNGLTDTLLPVTFWKTHDAWRLYPDADRPEGCFRSADGESTEIKIRVVDRGGAGRDDLAFRIGSAGDEERKVLGIPAGSFDRPSEPESVQVAWVLAFLLVRADGSVDLLSAHRRPVRLVDDKTARGEYLRKVCQGLETWMLEESEPPRLPADWPDGTALDLGPEPGVICVCVPNPAENLSLGHAESGSAGRAAERLGTALVRGRHWSPHSGQVWQLLPGDGPTALRISVLRGIQQLRQVVKSWTSEEDAAAFDLELWWNKRQSDFAQRLPGKTVLPPAGANDLIAASRTLRDTEFQEKLDWLGG